MHYGDLLRLSGIGTLLSGGAEGTGKAESSGTDSADGGTGSVDVSPS